MNNYLATAVLILTIILLYLWYIKANKEKFMRPVCVDCSDRKISVRDLTSINPFRWPFSGTSCPSGVYDAFPNIRDYSTESKEDIEKKITPVDTGPVDKINAFPYTEENNVKESFRYDGTVDKDVLNKMEFGSLYSWSDIDHSILTN